MTGSTVQSLRSERFWVAFPSRLEEVRPATLAVCNFLRDQGLLEEEIQACELALVEGCNNAVHYTGEKGRNRPVEIEVICSPERVQLRIQDHTAGFEYSPGTIGLPDPEKENGRGLFLIHSLMEEVDYFRGTGSNCLVMGRNRQRTLATPGEHYQSGFQEVSRKLVDSEEIIRDMAEELSFCYESLSAIFRCSAELGRNHSLEEFSQRLLTDLSQITSAEWFLLRVLAKEKGALVVFTASEPGLQLVPLALGGNYEHSAELEAALTGQDVWFDHLRSLEKTDPLGAVKPDSVGLIHPFFAGETLIGTLTVGKSAGKPHFTAVHANVIHSFADFLAIQIVNARFQEEQLTSRLVSRELEIARNIQRSLLPKVLPKIPGYHLAGFCESARQVGGDFYDVLRLENDSLLLIIADVMGKGIPAAIFACILRSLLRAVPEWTPEPALLLSRVNRLLFEELSGVDMFITAQLIYVDTPGRRLVAASAGHCPTLFAAGPAGPIKTLSPEGLPLGILPDTTFTNHTEEIGKNHRLLLYTDGLTEARNADGEFFGQERLLNWFQKSIQEFRSAEQLKEELAAELSNFQSSGGVNDDQTFLILAT